MAHLAASFSITVLISMKKNIFSVQLWILQGSHTITSFSCPLGVYNGYHGSMLERGHRVMLRNMGSRRKLHAANDD